MLDYLSVTQAVTYLAGVTPCHKYVTYLVLHKSHNALGIGRVTAHAL
jgi:hypothetical protein